ncbi:Ca2+-dependent phosphoinositide-specific phospholipase C [uncultured Polaribacter sp.]|uniref:Ca2+-dependent phosphoinositide-specific phospholipase C n=1 Tax=uncultured Polaribacter sp. TaxID=174711 RepID=UPI002618FA7E|nr:Ca2+-dependent phosphoinositide-specific phospholipase C [uncultured Polaribacter sp.]
MKLQLSAIILFFSCFISAQTREVLYLWPDEIPGETESKHEPFQTDNTSGDVIRLTNITNPSLTVFIPETPNDSKGAIIVSPGGGYSILAIDKGGYEIAEWLNGLGYTAFVLKYRVPKNRKGALQDIQRAIKTVRSKASLYNLNPQKIGVIGFSAGGHLSAMASTSYKKNAYPKIDDIDALSSRPNFSMLIYPAYLDKGENRSLSPELIIDEQTAPAFIFGTMDDPHGNSSLVIASALRDKKVPVELHMLHEGGHGYGLRKGNIAAETWPILAENWLKSIVKTKDKLNDIQVIGSHNSYKIPIEKSLFNYLFSLDSTKAKSLEYGHISLEEQLDLGLRNLELDIFHDPLGGYFSNPKGLEIVKSMGEEPLEFDTDKKLLQPGLKMFHVQDIDFRSHYLLFKEGLRALKNWSDNNPNHTPIFILINAKDQKVAGTREPLGFTENALDSIDVEIKSIFSADKLITPDMVRGDFKTLEEAVLTKGWPKLASVKGRFLFVLDEKEEKINRYLENHASLKNRVLFVNSKEGYPEAAFRIINNPITDFDYIKELVLKGYMVRTRADAGTKEARTNNYERFEKAKASGAQVISTDYYVPSTLFPSTFMVSFENNKYERLKIREHD